MPMILNKPEIMNESVFSLLYLEVEIAMSDCSVQGPYFYKGKLVCFNQHLRWKEG